jgi:hypothetical protein
MESQAEKKGIQAIEKITWIWDNTQGEQKASLFIHGDRTEIHLTKTKFDKWFTPKLEQSWISFKPSKFKPQDLDVFARVGESFYQTSEHDCWDTLLIFSLSEKDEIMKQDGKWIRIKQTKKQPTITQIKDFMF